MRRASGSASEKIEKWLSPSSSSNNAERPDLVAPTPSVASPLSARSPGELTADARLARGGAGPTDPPYSGGQSPPPQESARALSAAFAEMRTSAGSSSNGGYATPGTSPGQKWLSASDLPAASGSSPIDRGSLSSSMMGGGSRPGYSPPRYGQAPETLHSPAASTPAFSPATAVAAENERLYEAYNELHSLAQVFQKPFDAPAILIVGHQTDGKSALVEALMGFQFNHVGGGTKTRRPITLQMTYNPHRHEPRCYLVLDRDLGREELKTLPQLQSYIERENQRLESEGGRFGDREIVVRVEYKFCPNLTIIDTPGLISAAPGGPHNILQEQAATVEALVMAKMQQREFVILCLEDSNDWNNATTRKIVMAVDPELSRTIIVSTKLDTKIPQFSRASDVEMFLNPAIPGMSTARVGNKPFFTSVPSGRVGVGPDCVFAHDDGFREAVLAREQADVASLESKMGRTLCEEERSRIGVSRLRQFLEQLLQHRYLESVPFIVPLLEGELKAVTTRLSSVRRELGGLSDKEIKQKSRDFRDHFMSQLALLLRGTIAAPPETFGETLEDERARGGAFLGEGGQQMPWRNMPNAGMRLYGGAQYHRAMAEFRFVSGNVTAPTVSREEIVNSCGVEDFHDGTNYYRTACVIAVKKAWDVFEPFLRQLGFRLSHIVRRLFPIVVFLLKKEKEVMLQHDMFVDHVASSFHGFVDSTEASCIDRCIEDLTSTTRFVSWTLHQKNRTAFRSFMESSISSTMGNEAGFFGDDELGLGASGPAGSPRGAKAAAGGSGAAGGKKSGSGLPGGGGDPSAPSVLVKLLGSHLSSGSSGSHDTAPAGGTPAAAGAPTASPADAVMPAAPPGPGTPPAPPSRLADILEGSLWTRRLAPSSEDLVNALVARIFYGVRDHFVLSTELKFNCFFLMPLLDKYPACLREDLEAVASGDAEAVFDISRTRRDLERQEKELQEELARLQGLQGKFVRIHRSLALSSTPVKA